MEVKENKTGKIRGDKLHLKPTNITVVADTELQDADVCQNTLHKILCIKYFIDPGTESVGRKKAVALGCSFNCRRLGGFQEHHS